MNVPNHERKSFRDMKPEERAAIVEAILAGNAEAYGAAEWQEPSPWVVFDGIYRTRPRQLVIPWEHIKEEYKWAAMDMDGEVYAFKERPIRDKYDYCSDGFADISALSIDKSGIDWRESLVARPEGV